MGNLTLTGHIKMQNGHRKIAIKIPNVLVKMVDRRGIRRYGGRTESTRQETVESHYRPRPEETRHKKTENHLTLLENCTPSVKYSAFNFPHPDINFVISDPDRDIKMY